MSSQLYWREKRVLITGGSAGLGLALAGVLAQLGAKVAIVGRDAARLAAARRLEPKLRTIAGDVASKAAVHQIAGEAAAALGGIDVLINNASYLGATPLRLLADSDCEDLEQALATNVVGPFRLTKAVLPTMLLARRGLVVNISSDAAVNAYPTWGAYAASKAAADHLSRVFDAELHAQGVRFLAVDPGDMRTAMHFAAIPGADPAALAHPAEVALGLAAALPRASERPETRWSAAAWRELLKSAEGGV